jgi:hypothetical protein
MVTDILIAREEASAVLVLGIAFRGRRATEADSKHRFPVLESQPTEPGAPELIVECEDGRADHNFL